jgi:NAD(P)-dependent dehydrogenase (short-subunit alcohol dehydrogenase family)
MARVALVTGAGRGIGAAVTRRLDAAGYDLVLTARSADELDRVAAECAGKPLVVPTDLTAPGAVDEVFGAAEERFSRVDILVANAGVAHSAPLVRTTDADWDRVLTLNLTVPFRCLRRAMPAMVSAGWGRIVVIGSTASKEGGSYLSAYTASKHGVLGLARSAAAELAKTGVTVNAVCPAYVDTPMTDASVVTISTKTGRSPEQARSVLENTQPIGRLITVDEVATAVLFCVDSPSVTGQGINVDGGTVQS